MDETSSMLQKIRTLAVQARNGTNTADDKAALTKEANALKAEIDRIAQQTKFGGKTVLDGGGKDTDIYGGANATAQGKLTLQVGANSGDVISFNVDAAKFSNIAGNAGITLNKIWDNGSLKLTDGADIDNVIDAMDKMIGQIDSARAGLGAIQNRLESSIRNQANVSANQADARSRIRDADFAEESANLSQQSIIQQAATSMLMQANTRPQLGLSLLG